MNETPALQVDCRWDSVPLGDRAMPVYRCRPARSRPRAAVIVLQEIFGVNDHIQRVTERVAREGYLALAPDLFHRQGDRFTARYDEVTRGMERAKALREDDFLSDLAAVVGNARGELGSEAGVGVVGFCMGGTLAYVAACALPVSAAVSFYGGGIASGPIARTSGIRSPMLLFFGERDQQIPAADVEAIRRALKDNGKKAEVIVYPRAEHGFFCEQRKSYDPAAAKDSWKTLVEFFRKNLPA